MQARTALDTAQSLLLAPSTTGSMPAGAGTASSSTSAWRTASRASSSGRSPPKKAR